MNNLTMRTLIGALGIIGVSVWLSDVASQYYGLPFFAPCLLIGLVLLVAYFVGVAYTKPRP